MAEVLGVDVSHWQPPSSALVDKVKRTGARFVIIKASQGGRSRDSKMVDHHRRFGAAGLDRGAYHFYDFGATPRANADNFVAAMRGLPWEILPVLDAEHGGAGSKARTADALLEFLDRVEAGSGFRPIVYTYASWWNGAVEPRGSFIRSPLWIARYPSSLADGRVPNLYEQSTPTAQPWRTWWAWQFSTAASLDRNIAPRSTYTKGLRSGAPTQPLPEDPTMADTELLKSIDKKVQTLLDTAAQKAHAVKTPDGKVWVVTPEGRWHVPDAQTLDVLIFVGQVQGFGSEGVAKVGYDAVDGIPVLDNLT